MHNSFSLWCVQSSQNFFGDCFPIRSILQLCATKTDIFLWRDGESRSCAYGAHKERQFYRLPGPSIRISRLTLFLLRPISRPRFFDAVLAAPAGYSRSELPLSKRAEKKSWPGGSRTRVCLSTQINNLLQQPLCYRPKIAGVRFGRLLLVPNQACGHYTTPALLSSGRLESNQLGRGSKPRGSSNALLPGIRSK